MDLRTNSGRIHDRPVVTTPGCTRSHYDTESINRNVLNCGGSCSLVALHIAGSRRNLVDYIGSHTSTVLDVAGSHRNLTDSGGLHWKSLTVCVGCCGKSPESGGCRWESVAATISHRKPGGSGWRCGNPLDSVVVTRLHCMLVMCNHMSMEVVGIRWRLRWVIEIQ